MLSAKELGKAKVLTTYWMILTLTFRLTVINIANSLMPFYVHLVEVVVQRELSLVLIVWVAYIQYVAAI